MQLNFQEFFNVYINFLRYTLIFFDTTVLRAGIGPTHATA